MSAIPYPPEKNNPQVFPPENKLSQKKTNNPLGTQDLLKTTHPFFTGKTASDPPKKSTDPCRGWASFSPLLNMTLESRSCSTWPFSSWKNCCSTKRFLGGKTHKALEAWFFDGSGLLPVFPTCFSCFLWSFFGK